MGQTVQGVAIPLVVQTLPRTMVEKIRMVRLSPIMYRTIKSFTESSLKDTYQWRVGYEYPDRFEWVKEGKWALTVYKNVEKTEALELPVRGIYKITQATVAPVAVLKSLRAKGEIWFVLVDGEVGILYTGKVLLAFTKEAPIAITPMIPVPYARPISIREIVDTLLNYVSF